MPEESPVTYIGFGIKVGTRNENLRKHGLAHFTEHMLFKGTQKRKSEQIIFRLEEVGAEINAFTTKEETFLYSILPSQHFNRAFVLMADLINNSRFPQEETDKEKVVIIDEINSYKDSPAELIFDDFENLLFRGHALGHNILGTEASVKRFTPEMGRQFVKEFYTPDNITLFIQGKAEMSRICELAEYLFPAQPVILKQSDKGLKTFCERSKIDIPLLVHKRKGTYQHHIIMGAYAYSMYNNKRVTLSLINNIIGGPGMNSLLNMSLRETHGLAYNVESNYTAYTDIGMFTIYFGCSKENAEKCIELVIEVLNSFMNTPLSSDKLIKAKRQLKGQLAIAADNKESSFLSMGKSMMHYGKFDSLEQIYKKIDNITAQDISDVAAEVLDPYKMNRLVYY